MTTFIQDEILTLTDLVNLVGYRSVSKGEFQEEHLARPPLTRANLAIQTIQPPWHLKIKPVLLCIFANS